jgi:AhpD family alkylhydroperoxidase
MSKNYVEMTTQITAQAGEIKKRVPDAMSGFYSMSRAATADGALDKKTKELLALAMGIVQRCDGCIGFHVKALVSLGMTKDELAEVLAMAVYMGGGPALMYAADAMTAYEQFTA